MFSFVPYSPEYNKNGQSLLDFFNIKPEDGMMGDKINKYADSFIDKLVNKLGIKAAEFTSYIASDLVQLVSLGVITYSMFNCIRMMFLGNKTSNNRVKPVDKILFGYFIFFILRVLDTLIRVRGGVYGK